MADEKKDLIGIYTIANKETGEYYIGSGNLKTREYDHFYHLKLGDHSNHRFQEAYNRNRNFAFRGTPTPDRECAFALEQNAVNDNFGDPDMLNLSLNVRKCEPILSPETIEKISKAHIGLKPSDETKAKMSASARERVYSPEEIQKLTGYLERAQEARRVKVEVEGKSYDSIADVARAYDIDSALVRQRLRSSSPRFEGWKRTE